MTERAERCFEDFDELADWFVELGSHFSPAECHGAVVGALAGGMRLAAQEWAGFVSAVMGLDTEALTADTLAQHGQNMADFAAAELAALSATELDFALFLPDDDVEIELRTESLGSWCRGFLGGFAEAQLYRSKSGAALSEYPENVAEVLKDLVEIAKASLRGRAESADEDGYDDYDGDFGDGLDDGLDDETLTEDGVGFYEPLAPDMPSGDVDEADERHLLDISEYVRLAALTVYTEYGWVEAESGDAKPGSANARADGTVADDDSPSIH